MTIQKALKQTGFSMIETMVVLMIISLITSILLPNYSKIQHYAKEKTLKNCGYIFQLSIESFYLETNNYPDTNLSIDDLETLLQEYNIKTTYSSNPFTNQPFSSNDTSGKIDYTYDPSNDQYTLTLYGHLNENIVLQLTN